jgi:hypothetical protein
MDLHDDVFRKNITPMTSSSSPQYRTWFTPENHNMALYLGADGAE